MWYQGYFLRTRNKKTIEFFHSDFYLYFPVNFFKMVPLSGSYGTQPHSQGRFVPVAILTKSLGTRLLGTDHNGTGYRTFWYPVLPLSYGGTFYLPLSSRLGNLFHIPNSSTWTKFTRIFL